MLFDCLGRRPLLGHCGLGNLLLCHCSLRSRLLLLQHRQDCRLTEVLALGQMLADLILGHRLVQLDDVDVGVLVPHQDLRIDRQLTIRSPEREAAVYHGHPRIFKFPHVAPFLLACRSVPFGTLPFGYKYEKVTVKYLITTILLKLMGEM
jgi:hypothetical protein